MSIFFLPFFVWRLVEICKMRRYKSYLKNPVVKVSIVANGLGAIMSLINVANYFADLGQRAVDNLWGTGLFSLTLF